MAGLAALDEAFADVDVRRVALSADAEEGGRKMKDDEDLDFPVLYGVDCDEAREQLGLYISEKGGEAHLQPAQFILDPDGVVRFASYSSGKVGRLSAREALDEIASLRS